METHEHRELDLDKYNFVVKPGTPGFEEMVAEFTLEQFIQQAKAFRAYHWDKWGVTGELGPEYFEMEDDNIRDMEEELENEEFNKSFDAMTDEQLIYTARSWLINMTADDGAVARQMGYSGEQIARFRKMVAAFEKSVDEVNKIVWKEDNERVTKAAADLLKELGPSSAPVVFPPPRPPADADNN